jgi:pyrroloquinoline quinone (PQQ) biosynthesis protein C
MLWNETAQRSTASATQPWPSADQIVASYARREVADHPFFVRVRERPADLTPIWLLMANLRAGISRDFVSWLAWTIARVEDRRIGCLIAKQLSDELGNGEFGRIHSLLLDRFVNGLESFRPPQATGNDLLGPGEKLCHEAARCFLGEPYEGVGALMVGELFAEKMDRCVGDAVRRHGGVDTHALTWLMLHEALEVNHAADSDGLAELIPKQGPELAATWRGAIEQWRVLWQFLDDVDVLALSL